MATTVGADRGSAVRLAASKVQAEAGVEWSKIMMDEVRDGARVHHHEGIRLDECWPTNLRMLNGHELCSLRGLSSTVARPRPGCPCGAHDAPPGPRQEG